MLKIPRSFSEMPKPALVGFEPLVATPEPATPDIALIQQTPTKGPLTAARAAVEAATIYRPMSFSHDAFLPSGDSLFKQRTAAAALHIREVVHRIVQPNPQSGNKIGKRYH